MVRGAWPLWLAISALIVWPPDAPFAAAPGTSEPPVMTATEQTVYAQVTFADIPGWADDDQAAALAAFKVSCAALLSAAKASATVSNGLRDVPLLAACSAAGALAGTPSAADARAFFERYFDPYRVAAPVPADGLLTAYYEPILSGRRTQQPGYGVPIHRRPADLVNLVDEADRAARPAALTHARKTASGDLVPFATREEIDRGALAGQGLELFYLADEVDRFFLQVQGSGVVDLGDGMQVRVTYDGKNGHPYTSVGRYLIDKGLMGADTMSLDALGDWLRHDRERGRQAIWQNRSYVFFREMKDGASAVGVMGVQLTPLRSLAIDPAFHALGLPIFVDAPEITHMTGRPFRRLMIGQDVGSAIKGAERGDIYAGSGPAAGKIAGITKHAGRFYVLLPKQADGVER